MVFFNYSTMQMAAKIVYYGPGLCGKTTNLQYIYGHTSKDSRGEMVSLETETDRTLFFDLLPIDVGKIAGFNTRIQLYTVPGQVFYNTTRKLVLKGVDGVVFVADSQRPMLQANVESFANLEENLAEIGLTTNEMPLVLQYNKRDLKEVCTVEELDQAINKGQWPAFEASAIQGKGVFETLKGISKLTLLALKQRLAKTQPRAAAAPAPAPTPTPGTSAPETTPPQPPPTPPAAAPPPQATTATGPATVQEPSPLPTRAAPPASAPPQAPAAPEAPPPQATPPSVPAAAEQSAPPQSPVASPPEPAAPPARQAPSPTPSAAAAEVAAEPARKPVDILAELEKIRQQAVGAPAAAPPPANGKSEIAREIQLTLSRADFCRARRFHLNLQLADESNQVVNTFQDQVVLDDVSSLNRLLLRLNIAFSSEG